MQKVTPVGMLDFGGVTFCMGSVVVFFLQGSLKSVSQA